MIEFIVIGIILGLLPAAIARTRGQDFFLWWVYGAFLFPIALIHALVVKPGSKAVEQFVTGKVAGGQPAPPRRPMTREELREAMTPGAVAEASYRFRSAWKVGPHHARPGRRQ